MMEKGGDNMRFEGRRDLSGWLNDKPEDWSRSIATRAALRVTPLVLGLPFGRPDGLRPALTLSVFRAVFISWAARNYPAHDMSARAARAAARAAATAATAATTRAATTAARAADAAAAAARTAATTDAATAAATDAARAATAAAAAATAATAAATARTAAATAAATEFWDSVSADARWLSANSNGSLIHQPIWLNDVRGDRSYKANFPTWARTPFDAFAESDRAQGDWGVIVNWYRAILPNGPNRMPQSAFGKEADIALALQPEEFWRVGETTSPNEVMAKIKALIKGADNFPTRIDAQPEPGPFDDDGGAESKQFAHTTGVQLDGATSKDELGREGFALRLVDEFDAVLKVQNDDGEARGFAVNLHAPWGAGKSSVLKIMKGLMTSGTRNRDTGWVVVWFDAWRNERRKPPWWAMMESIYEATLEQLNAYGLYEQSKDVDATWTRWSRLSDWLPLVIALAIVASIFFLVATAIMDFGDVGTILSALTGAIALAGSAFVAMRGVIFGSNEQARFFFDLKRDPLKQVAGLFSSLTQKHDRPVCVFIDDLDRCNANYVVDLLEGIQTAFRNKDTVYVVAADRKWLKAAFEARYKKDFEQVETPAQPLGHLFLDKIFQVSVPLPPVSRIHREEYMGNRLRDPVSQKDEAQEDIEGQADVVQAELDRAGSEQETSELLGQKLEGAKSQVEKESIALAASRSRAVQKQREHQLTRFGSLIPFNPRALKRLVNAYNLRADPEVIGDSSLSDALARWVVLEQAYPGLVDLLAARPARARAFLLLRGDEQTKSQDPNYSHDEDEEIQIFLYDQTINTIFADPADAEIPLGEPLTERAVRFFTQGMR